MQKIVPLLIALLFGWQLADTQTKAMAGFSNVWL